MTRLDLGQVQYVMVWSGANIIIQFKIELVVVCILVDETANLGLVQELFPILKETLGPIFLAIEQST
jgi:hypothetical protein